MKNTLLVLLALMSSLVSAQNLQNANWLFGEYAGLKFTTSPTPTPLLPSTATGMDARSGVATISDPEGNLMFYTDGIRVWNKNHQVMPNGTGLFGSVGGTQTAVIIPRPNDNTRFFIATLDGYLGGQRGLHYSEVDITLNGGLGDVIAASKNTVLKDHLGVSINTAYGNQSHRITYYPHSNGHDYWLITQINEYVFSHLVTETGISLNAAQASAAPWISNYPPNASGQMKVSPDGTKIAMTYASAPNGNGAVFLGSFNSATGVVAMNPSTIVPPTIGYWMWGLEFSPNSQIIYYANETVIYAYNIPTAQTEAVGAFTDSDPTLQLAIDGKIYITTDEQDKLSQITNPNVFGVGCNYEYATVSLNGRLSHNGLPGWVYWQNQKLWPRTFGSTFVRAEPRDVQTDNSGNIYYVGSMHNNNQPINVRSHEDNDFIIPYLDEHLQPGFNPANYAQPQYSFSQLIKLDKYGNTIWHKPLNGLWDHIHMRKTADRIFIYQDSPSSPNPNIKEVISLNNTIIMPAVNHNWGAYNGLDQSGYEIFVRKIAANNFVITLVNPNTNAVMSTVSVNVTGTQLHDTAWLKVIYCAGTDYLFQGEYLHPCPTPPCPIFNTIKVVHAKKIGSGFTLAPTILYQFDNDYYSYKHFQHLFFNNRLFLGYFNENIYETHVGTSTPINANIKIYNYSPGTFTGTGITITTPGDYLYGMTAVNNKVLYIGHRRLYEGVASSNYSPAGVITFPAEAAGKIATYDNLGNIILAGKYWRQPTLTLPGGTQLLTAYGGGYTYPSNPYFQPPVNGAGHHFITKFKPAGSGGYNFYRPAASAAEGKKLLEDEKIVLYPNPAEKEITLQTTKAYTNYQIFSVDGKLMDHGEIYQNEPLTVDVSAYAKGSYFVKLQNDKGEEDSRQFLKM